MTVPMKLGLWRRPPGQILVAGLAAGAIFDAVNLWLRFPLGVPSLPEAISDLLVPFIPASTFGRLLSTLGPYGKQIVIGASLLGVGLGIAAAVVVYDRVRNRFGTVRATAGLLVAGWLILAGIFWTVLGANDHGGTLPARYALALADLGVSATAAAATALLLARRGGAGNGDAAPVDPRRRGLLGAMAAGVALLAVGGTGVVAGVRQLLKLSNVGYEGYGTPASALGPITPTRNFYVVSKNLVDPIIDVGTWQLAIEGQVQRPRSLSIADLQQLPQVESVVTLECIANGVGGSLMSTARWVGPTMVDVLATAGISGNPTHAELHAVDGYYDAVRVEELSTPGAVLALRMNGEVLPDRHGYPARVVLPGRYGEKQMKWLSRVVLTDTPATGFYQRQGWSEVGTIRTWSRFDNVSSRHPLPAGLDYRVSGHAFAGTRGIAAVRVSTDNGNSWFEADLDAVISPNAWRYFSWTWPAPVAGTYQLLVRARDGMGTWQEPSYEDIVPRGSSGLHRVRVDVG